MSGEVKKREKLKILIIRSRIKGEIYRAYNEERTLQVDNPKT